MKLLILLNKTDRHLIHYIRRGGGFSRVGCFPCIMCRHGEIKNIIDRYPDVIRQITEHEYELKRSFFPPNYIPKWAMTGIDSNGKKFPWMEDVVKYILNKKSLKSTI